RTARHRKALRAGRARRGAPPGLHGKGRRAPSGGGGRRLALPRRAHRGGDRRGSREAGGGARRSPDAGEGGMIWIAVAVALAATALSGGRPIAFAAWLLPMPVALFLGARLGDLLRLVGVRKRIARQNLAQAFPDKSDAEREAILRAFYRHLGTLIVEFLRAPYLSERAIRELVEVDWESYRRFEAERAARGGAIVATAHFGNFELLGSFFARIGLPLTAITKALPKNVFNRFWLDQWR